MSVRAVWARRAVVAVVVSSLVAMLSVVGLSRPAEASPTSVVVAGAITVTNGPHVVGWVYEGDGAQVTTPVTNVGPWPFSGFFPGFVLLLNISLFTVWSHLALSSVQMHLDDPNNPSCLATLTGSRLVNFVGGTSYQLLSTMGTYSLSNCSILVVAMWQLAFGASPSPAHLLIDLDIENSLVAPTTTTTTTTTTVPPDAVLTVVAGVITVTNGPHVVGWVYEGDGAQVTTPVTNVGPWPFSGFFPGFVLLLNISLFTAGSHLALSSVQMHLDDPYNPNCLATLTGSRLVNFVGGTSYQLLSVMGTYSLSNCGVLVTAMWQLAFGSSPSSAHLLIELDIDHVED